MHPEHSKVLNELFEAIEKKDQEFSIHLINQIKNINGIVDKSILHHQFIERDANGVIQKSALHLAAKHDLIDVVKAVYQEDGVLDYKDANGKFAVQLAIESFSTKVIKFFYNETYETLLGNSSEDYNHEIHLYVEDGFQREIAEKIFSEGDVEMLTWFCIQKDQVVIDADRPIDYAAASGNFKSLEWVIDNFPLCLDESENVNDHAFPPTLMYQASNIEVVKFLVEKGYRFDSQSIVELIYKFGKTGLDLLKLRDVDLNIKDYRKETSLKAAMRIFADGYYYTGMRSEGILNAILFLINQDIKIDFSDSDILLFCQNIHKISQQVSNKNFLDNPLFASEDGLLALNKVLEAALNYQKSEGVSNQLYDELSNSTYDNLNKHIKCLDEANFKFQKNVIQIPDLYKKIISAEKSSWPEISEEERPKDYNIFARLKEAYSNIAKILSKDFAIVTRLHNNPVTLIKGILAILNGKTIEEKESVPQIKPDLPDAVLTKIASFISSEDLVKCCFFVPIKYFQEIDNLLAQEEVNQEAKRIKLGDSSGESSLEMVE